MPFHRKRRQAAAIADSLQHNSDETLADFPVTAGKLPVTPTSVAVISALILGLPLLAVAKPHKTETADDLSGAAGWTSGSQTYIRARPGTDTPPVAKVEKHTQLYVWGKYNGWYRVETPDHHFGWVFNSYVNVPQQENLQELSHRKAKLASDRTASQKMYGSAELLKRHYETYRATGAIKGLREQGITVAAARPKPAAKPAVQLASARPVAKPVAKSLEKPAAAPVVVRRRVPAERPAAPLTAEWSLDGSTATMRRNVDLKPQHTAHDAGPQMRPEAPEVEATENIMEPVVAATVAPVAPVVTVIEKPVAPQTVPAARIEAKPAPVFARPAASATKTKPNTAQRAATVAPARVPPVADPNSVAITPEELLKARSEFLGPRGKTVPNAGSDAPATVKPEKAQPMATAAAATDAKPAARRAALSGSKHATVQKVAKGPYRGGSPRDYARLARADFGQQVVDLGLKCRGMPYIHGASSPSSGFDCSGFVSYLLRTRGLNPPRTSSDFASYGTAVARDNLKPGDILLFANTYRHGISHVGIYIGNNKFVHAANPSKGVCTDSLESGYYAGKYAGARRAR